MKNLKFLGFLLLVLLITILFSNNSEYNNTPQEAINKFQYALEKGSADDLVKNYCNNLLDQPRIITNVPTIYKDKVWPWHENIDNNIPVGNVITGNFARGAWLYNDNGIFSASLQYNSIYLNIGDGLELDNVNGGTSNYDLGNGTLKSVGYNSFYANYSGVDIDNNTSDTIWAESNWWGSDPPNPARLQGSVNYLLWLFSDPN